MLEFEKSREFGINFENLANLSVLVSKSTQSVMEDIDQFTYPALECERLRPVPGSDCSYRHRDEHGVLKAELVRDAKTSHETPFYELRPLLSEPLRLSLVHKFPSVETFNDGLEFLRKHPVGVPPTFPTLDDQLRAGLQGYEPFHTNQAYYEKHVLRGIREAKRARSSLF